VRPATVPAVATTLTALPDRFNAGTTVKYTRTHGDYPASQGWSLSLYLNGAASLTILGSPNGNAFNVTVPAAQTATVSVADASTTAGSKTLGKGAGSFVTDGVRAGDLVSGPGIPSGAYVDGNFPIGATSLTLSEAATATASGLAVKFRFPDGVYSWEERASKAGEVFVADEGTVNVDPDIAGAPAGAFQTWEERMLPLVNDIIEGRITSDMESYQIADRAKTAVRMRDWMAFRGFLKAAISGQANPGKLTMVRAAFTGAGAEA
jgi:hypothetical protein